MSEQPEPKYAPLPWSVGIVEADGDRSAMVLSAGVVIADCSILNDQRECEKIAAVIVRAVNSHNALVKVLRECLADYYSHPNFTNRRETADRIRAALKDAE